MERFKPVWPPTVERRASWALAADYFGGKLYAQRLYVRAVGEIRIGHDGRRIGIDQDHFKAVGTERLASLRAGVIELAGLADDDGTGADDQDAMDVVASRHRYFSNPVAESPPLRDGL